MTINRGCQHPQPTQTYVLKNCKGDYAHEYIIIHKYGEYIKLFRFVPNGCRIVCNNMRRRVFFRNFIAVFFLFILYHIYV